MFKAAVRTLGIVALATLAAPVQGEDDFPLVGTYTENQACAGDVDSWVERGVELLQFDVGFIALFKGFFHPVSIERGIPMKKRRRCGHQECQAGH